MQHSSARHSRGQASGDRFLPVPDVFLVEDRIGRAVQRLQNARAELPGGVEEEEAAEPG